MWPLWPMAPENRRLSNRFPSPHPGHIGTTLYNTRHLSYLLASIPLPISIRWLNTSYLYTSPNVIIIPPAPSNNARQHIAASSTLRITADRKIPHNHATLIEQLAIFLHLYTLHRNTPELRITQGPQTILDNTRDVRRTWSCGSSLPNGSSRLTPTHPYALEPREPLILTPHFTPYTHTPISRGVPKHNASPSCTDSNADKM